MHFKFHFKIVGLVSGYLVNGYDAKTLDVGMPGSVHLFSTVQSANCAKAVLAKLGRFCRWHNRYLFNAEMVKVCCVSCTYIACI